MRHVTRHRDADERPAIVMITPALPFDSVPHAGGRYLLALQVALSDAGLGQVLLAPDTPSNRAAAGRPGCPAHVLVGPPSGDGVPVKAARRAMVVADARGRRLDPGLPNVALAAGLGRARVRSLLAGAEVIDLQWSESIRLAGLARRLAPRARLVGTFHDVQSQLFERETGRPGQHPAAWRARAAWARRWERRAVALLDDVVVFSDKDAALLPPGRAAVHVVRPPLAPAVWPAHHQPAVPTVLLVSYLAREENSDAARWLLGEIWLRVTRVRPDARLRLAGAGADAALGRLAAASGTEVLGYVDDLDAEYAGASACVVPLRGGAGVKFKTVEAILAGVPVVATPTGAEGVAGADRLGRLPETAAEVADALLGVLADPGPAQERADRLQRWAMGEFGADGLRWLVRDVYAAPMR